MIIDSAKEGQMDIQQALDDCIRDAYATRSLNTGRTYTNALNIFSKFLSDQGISTDSPVTLISIEPFIKFPSWLAQQGYSKKTSGAYVAGTKFLLDWMVIHGFLKPDYSETLRFEMAVKQISRKRETRLPRTPEKGVLEKIVNSLYNINWPLPRKERNIALILFLMTTGCRNNEVVNLRIKDIDLNGQNALVVGKGNKERRVFFNSETAKALDNYWKIRGFREKLHPAFARHDKGTGKKIQGLTTKSVRDIVDEVTAVAGLDKGTFTPHYFRHAFAIKMLQETHDLALVQDLLGHASPSSTRVYAKIYPEEMERAHKKVWEKGNSGLKDE